MNKQLYLVIFLLTASCLFKNDGLFTGTDHETETGGGIPDSVPNKKEIPFSEKNYEYSGYLYFSQTAKKLNYVVFVNVYDVEGRFIGRSDTYEFTNRAGGNNG